MVPKPGDVLLIDAAASVQFADDRALRMRVISVSDRSTYDGWAWITGYALDDAGRAVDRREVFVACAGLRLVRRNELPETGGDRGRSRTAR